MNKLEILEAQIRKDLPRLLKPTVGCILSVKESIYSPGKTKLLNKDDRYIILKKRDKGFYIYNLSNMVPLYIKKELIFKDFNIIGHDILLSDVLEWLNTEKIINILCKEIEYTRHSGFVTLIQEGYLDISHWSGEYEIERTSRLGKWDLTKPYLKDQNEKIIKCLYNLVKNHLL